MRNSTIKVQCLSKNRLRTNDKGWASSVQNAEACTLRALSFQRLGRGAQRPGENSQSHAREVLGDAVRPAFSSRSLGTVVAQLTSEGDLLGGLFVSQPRHKKLKSS